MSKSESMQQRAEFHKIFREQITPILRNYEVYRKKEYGKFVVHVCILVPIIILGLICVFFTNIIFSLPDPDKYIFMFIIPYIIFCIEVIYIIIYSISIMNKNKNFKNSLKKNCLTKVLNVFGDIKWKTNFDWIYDIELNSSGLFLPFNIRTTDDTFKGSLNGVDYKISETCLKDIHKYGRISTYVRVFNGIVIKLKWNKNIKNRTVVATKGNLTKRNSIVTSALIAAVVYLLQGGINLHSMIIACVIALGVYFTTRNKLTKEEPLNVVTLEDPKFNKRFNVYSSDQVEARYLVTPSFMERLYNLQTSFGAKTIKCSFYEDYLMIAISTKRDLFELGDLFHPLLEANSHVQLYRDLHSILNLIDYFKLDEKVGL